nr:MAG TPA: PROTEIN TRANSPORT PROTEIN SEC61 SUBUNIT, PROTEIN EXIT TUNNEL, COTRANSLATIONAL.48A [Caudoviricetes sp.]
MIRYYSNDSIITIKSIYLLSIVQLLNIFWRRK